MTNLNSVILIGNLTKDCGADERDFGYVANGQARANITIAVNRSKKVGDEWQNETSYFDITVWGKQAENLKPYFVKGQKIAVKGYLKQDRWESDGQKKSRVTIVAESIELCGNKKDSNSTPAVNNNTQQNNYDNTSYGGDSFPEDVPF